MRLLNGRIQFRTAAVVTVLLPFSSFIICVLWSLYFDFASSTATHCGVNNSKYHKILFDYSFYVATGT